MQPEQSKPAVDPLAVSATPPDALLAALAGATGPDPQPLAPALSTAPAADPLVPGEEIHALALRYFKDLLKINTSNPPGNERPAIDYVAGVLRAHNIPFQVLAQSSDRPNLYAELPGAPGEKPILLSSHVDVVPVEAPERWKHDPFGAVEEEGMIYGRGALDVKYKTAFDLAFMVHASKHERVRPVKMLALADEEAGAGAGSKYVTEQHRDLIDAEYVFNEVGGFNLRLGMKEVLPIQIAEKTFCHLRIEIPGHSMHASIPAVPSAALTLSQAIVAIHEGFDAYKVSDSARVFLETVAKDQPAPIAQLFAGLLDRRTFGQALAAFPDPAIRAQICGLLAHTVTPTILEAGLKVNVTPGHAAVEFDCRLIPGLDSDGFVERLKSALGPELSAKANIEILSFCEGYEVPADDPMVQAVGGELERYWSARFGQAHFAPLLLPASSDNSVYYQAGIKPIGFAPLKLPENFPGYALAHADDERLPRDSFERGLECYFHVLGGIVFGKRP